MKQFATVLNNIARVLKLCVLNRVKMWLKPQLITLDLSYVMVYLNLVDESWMRLSAIPHSSPLH
jgi:hypothetical protein